MVDGGVILEKEEEFSMCGLLDVYCATYFYWA